MNIKKRLIVSSFVLLSFGISGCGNQESDASCRVQLEMDLDAASNATEYQAVRDKATGECSGAISTTELSQYKAATYLGEAGISIAGLAPDLLEDGADPMNVITAKVSGVEANQLIDLALAEFDTLVTDEQCTNKANLTLSSAQLSACTTKEFVKPLMAVSNLSLVAGESVTFEGKEVTAISALQDPASVGIDTDNSDGISATEFDINGSGTIDSSEFTAFAIGYASALAKDQNNSTTTEDDNYVNAIDTDDDSNGSVDGQETFKAADILTNVNFTKNGTRINADHSHRYVEIELTNKYDFATSGNKKEYKLIETQTSSSDATKVVMNVAVTNGLCEVEITTSCTTRNNTDCFPCPVVSADGSAMNATDGIADMLNESEDENMSQIKEDMYCADYDKTTHLPADKKGVCEDGGDFTGDITSEDIANYLSK